MNCRRSKTSGRFYGSTVHNCPYCDGWECRDQPIAVTGGNQDSVDLAIELLLGVRTWCSARMVLSRAIAKPWKPLEIGHSGHLRRLFPGSRARVTSWKESGLSTAIPPAKRAFFLTGAVSALASGEQLGCEFLRGFELYSVRRKCRYERPEAWVGRARDRQRVTRSIRVEERRY